MLVPSISNETNQLQCVLLGVADQSGPPPKYEETYDPKSRLHIAKGTYPEEQDLIDQLDLMQTALKKHGVEVLRPQIVHNCNQIFSRDIAFVVEDRLFISNILPARDKEIDAIQHILEQIPKDKIRKIPEDVHVEGGDVIVHNEFLFVGFYDQPDYADYVTARTNAKALSYISAQFPQKKVIGFELNKSNDDPFANTLHLDCCFQPFGNELAIVYPEGFMHREDVKWIENHFGSENLFVTDNTKHSYHPGRSGSVTFKSEKGPHLAYFGEIHPAIIKNLDCKDKNIFGFEIFLKNIPEPNKKLRQSKKSFQASDYQKSERDFAFVIDKIFKIGALEKIIREVDENLIQSVSTFDVFEGENKGLKVAEVELDSETQDYDLPVWLGKEVSYESKYYNAALITNPFKNWE